METSLATIPLSLTPEEKAAKRQKRFERKREAKLLADGMKVTLADIEYALRKHNGGLADTARFLGTTRAALKRKIQMTPILARVCQEIKEEKLDKAEQKLLEHVEDGYFPAVAFTLKTLGQSRGYTERATVEHEVGAGTIRNAASLIEAMKKGAKELERTISVEEDEGWEDIVPSEK